jgi:hypothetical protein
MSLTVEQAALSFVPAHPDLPHSAGVPAQAGSDDFIEALARVVFYWAYPGVDTYGRTNVWQIMEGERGTLLGILPGGPKNYTGGLGDYMSPAQRWVVTPNYDTIYGAGFFDLNADAVVVQTPVDVPTGHYWTIQIVDVMTNVVHQLGSARGTAGGKFLLVGPGWEGELPDGFLDVLRMPTEIGAVLPRSFATESVDGKKRARSVLNQLGMYPLAENPEGQFDFAYDEYASHGVFPPGVTAEMIAANPSASRPDWVKPHSFWEDLGSLLDNVAHFGPDDTAMADQARALVHLHRTEERYRSILDRIALDAFAGLRASSNYVQAGLDAGNGWRRQPNGGLWGTDWYGRAVAAVMYIFVNDYHEAVYQTRGLDSDGQILDGLEQYTITFDESELPPVDGDRGGFWSITMYNDEVFMLADPLNGRVNVGTASLDQGGLRIIDGKLTLYLGAIPPEGENAQANWLPAPHGAFCLAFRGYVPQDALLNGEYVLPEVVRAR